MKAENRLDHEVQIFLQFNTSKEAEKSGFETYHALCEAAELCLPLKKLQLAGVMTMGTLRTDNFERDAGRCPKIGIRESRGTTGPDQGIEGDDWISYLIHKTKKYILLEVCIFFMDVTSKVL